MSNDLMSGTNQYTKCDFQSRHPNFQIPSHMFISSKMKMGMGESISARHKMKKNQTIMDQSSKWGELLYCGSSIPSVQCGNCSNWAGGWVRPADTAGPCGLHQQIRAQY